MDKIIIAAISENNIIGKEGRLPWNIKSEMDFFRKTTYGYPIIMGFNTYLSLKEPLVGRTNIVVTQKNIKNFENVYFVNSLQKALMLAETINNKKLFIIGGGKIFEQTINIVDLIIISRIKGIYEGDSFFPELNLNVWELYNLENKIKFNIEYYRRKI